MPRNTERGAERLRIGSELAQGAQRDIAELPRGVRGEDLRSAVDGVHGLSRARFTRIARSKGEVGRTQRLSASSSRCRHPL